MIESTDAGATWTSRSLDGRADFHSLQARHGFVYGYDHATGELMVTAALKDGDTRSHVGLGDFAVSPADPDVVVGVTDRGVVRSQDGGRSFTAPAGPVLLLVSWAEDGPVVGVTPRGVVHVSDDGGATWDKRGALNGLAEAVEAASGREHLRGRRQRCVGVTGWQPHALGPAPLRRFSATWRRHLIPDVVANN